MLNSKAILAKNNNLWGLIDMNNKEIISFNYNNIIDIYENTIIVSSNEKLGCINANGNILLEPIYDEIDLFKYNNSIFAITTLNAKYELYNIPQNKVIEPTYDEIRPLNNGLIPVSLNGQWFYIDTEGNQLK